ncbi:MAG: signal peptidase I [Ruminococcus sp.]|nr:signal peptidase I [Ruminococcus sp.]
MKKALSIILNVLAWIILLFALLVTILVFSSSRNGDTAKIFGYIPLTVETDSMKPTFKSGDLIIIKEIDDIYTLEKGDVITYWTIIDGKRVKNTHRIVDINEFESSRSFVMKGDANDANDEEPALPSDIIGKWNDTKIGGAGKIMDFLRTKKGFFICIVIPMILFFLFELYKFIVTLIEVKKPALSEEDEEEIKKRAIEEYLAEQKKEDAADEPDNKAQQASDENGEEKKQEDTEKQKEE